MLYIFISKKSKSDKLLSKLLNNLAFLITSFAPTDVASILSFGKIGFGSITTSFEKLKVYLK